MTHPQEKGATGTLLRILPGVIISLVAIIVLAKLIDPAAFWVALRQVNLWYLAAYMVVSLAWLAVRAQLWRILLAAPQVGDQAARVRYSDVFLTINAGYLLNNTLPLRMGEVGRAYLMSLKSGLPFWRIAPTVVIERLLDIAFAAGIFLLTLPPALAVIRARAGLAEGEDMNAAATSAIVIGVVMVVGLVAVHLVARYRENVSALLERWLPERVAGRLRPFYANLFEGIAVVASLPRYLQVVAWEILNWALAFLQFTVLILAFFPPQSPFWGTLLHSAFTMGTFALGIAVPSTPASIGVYEAAFSTPLILLGADQSTAVACAVLSHGLQFVLTAGFVAAALSRSGLSFASLASTLSRLRSSD